MTTNDDEQKVMGADLAANMARQKLGQIFRDAEPQAKVELAEVERERGPLSKHQRKMEELAQAGLSMEDIQTAWHNYYVSLPDDEKHKVWQEFYESQQQAAHIPVDLSDSPVIKHHLRQHHEGSSPSPPTTVRH